MKKLTAVFLSVFVVTIFGVMSVFASKDVTVEFDGKVIEFDVSPEIVDGRTMVPLRKIFEEFGALVKWDDDTETVSARKNKKTIEFVIGSSNIKIDKGKKDDVGNPITEIVKMEVPAKLINGRTFVPVRAISESFGLDVKWNEESQEVIIKSETAKDELWKENKGLINLDDLTFEGKGIEIKDNQIKITTGGDFELKGNLLDGNILVLTKEKVKLRLSGVNITSTENPCIFAEDADKLYITVTENTENYLYAKNSEDGAIYSKSDLEIKGNGKLSIKSPAGHGVKASDNLNIENGIITIDAETDGIHINDTFKMTGGELDITAIGDGIDSESIVIISGGKINIETNAVPVQQIEETKEVPRPPRGMWGETPSVEFMKSSKGINAEWMLTVSDGEININSASHGVHCSDEIEINGGKFHISSKYDKGISAHGNLTVNGKGTKIIVNKSTEGLESKNVLTVNDGYIKVISTDDALNATGGSSGMMPPIGNFDGKRENQRNNPPDGTKNVPEINPKRDVEEKERPERDREGWFIPKFEMPENGEFIPPFEMPEDFVMPEGMERPPFDKNNMPQWFMGGNRENMKNCLIINGGYFELSGQDDCIDSNGNMLINGGTVKASNTTGSFYGNFGVVDPDGQLTINEKANIILASTSGNEKSMKLTQNTIVVYFETVHNGNEKIKISDSEGNLVYEYVPGGNYKAVLVASKHIKTGEKYMISGGSEKFEAEISEQTTVVGTPDTPKTGFGKNPKKQ